MPRPAGYHWDRREAYVHPENGRKSCRWCKGVVRPPKKNWCGNPRCVIEWTMRTDPQVLRRVVFDRDRGVCAECGLDTNDLDLGRLTYQLYAAERIGIEGDRREGWRKWTPRVEVVTEGGVGRPLPAWHWRRLHAGAVAWRASNKVKVDEPAWQVDHRRPVADGGDWFGMDNLVSLCVPCHRDKTRRENRERAARRRSANGAP
jgi:5-methylcytosine-specific restriction endonuclease McrA